jgi:hypothetical protein
MIERCRCLVWCLSFVGLFCGARPVLGLSSYPPVQITSTPVESSDQQTKVIAFQIENVSDSAINYPIVADVADISHPLVVALNPDCPFAAANCLYWTNDGQPSAQLLPGESTEAQRMVFTNGQRFDFDYAVRWASDSDQGLYVKFDHDDPWLKSMNRVKNIAVPRFQLAARSERETIPTHTNPLPSAEQHIRLFELLTPKNNSIHLKKSVTFIGRALKSNTDVYINDTPIPVDRQGLFRLNNMVFDREGEYTVTITARHIQFGEHSETIRLLIDLPPQITLEAPLNGAVIGENTVEIRGRVNDPYARVHSLNQSIPVAGDGSFEGVLQIRNGQNLLTIEAIDQRGQTSLAHVSVTGTFETTYAPTEDTILDYGVFDSSRQSVDFDASQHQRDRLRHYHQSMKASSTDNKTLVSPTPNATAGAFDPLTITVTEPRPDTVIRQWPVMVRGQLSNPLAQLSIHQRSVEVHEDGSFSYSWHSDQRNGALDLTVSAFTPGQDPVTTVIALDVDLPPEVVIKTPVNGETATSETYTVKGRVNESEAQVLVNDVPALVDVSGTFIAQNVSLTADNAIVVRATDASGQQTSDRITLLPNIAFQELRYGDSHVGFFSETDPHDIFTFPGRKDDELLITFAGSKEDDIQLFIRAFDTAGRLVKEAIAGGGRMNLTLPKDDTYRLWISERDGQDYGPYAISIFRINSPTRKLDIDWNEPMEHTLNTVTGINFYEFIGEAGDELTITFSSPDTSELKIMVEIYDEQGHLIQDVSAKRGTLTTRLPTTATYRVWVSDRNRNATGSYTIQFQE